MPNGRGKNANSINIGPYYDGLTIFLPVAMNMFSILACISQLAHTDNKVRLLGNGTQTVLNKQILIPFESSSLLKKLSLWASTCSQTRATLSSLLQPIHRLVRRLCYNWISLVSCGLFMSSLSFNSHRFYEQGHYRTLYTLRYDG